MGAGPLVEQVGPDPDLVAVLTDVFTDYRAGRAAPTEVVDLDRDLWARLEQLGLTRLTGAPARGGSGGSWADAAALLGLAAGAAAPVPLAEHDLLAGWLLEEADLPDDGRLRTACRADPSGVALDVPWAREATHVVALWEDGDAWRVADVPAERLRLTERRTIAGAPSDTVEIAVADLEGGALVAEGVGRQFHLRGALARSAQAVGAMERIVEIVLLHAAERSQFGRPIARFQAVQHLVADIASETALARAATDAAVARASTSDWSDPGLLFAVGVAKSCVGHGASVVVRGSHQVLGAIGTTVEHELHSLTRPILAWRSDYGSLHEWDETLTSLAVSAGHDRLWSLMTTGRAKPAARPDDPERRHP